MVMSARCRFCTLPLFHSSTLPSHSSLLGNLGLRRLAAAFTAASLAAKP
jgi:hypothetical protein